MPDFIQSLDAKILFYIQSLHNSVLDKFMPLVTFLGDKGLIWIIVCFVLLFSKKYRFVGILGFCALISSGLISEHLIKSIVQRPRPFITYPQELLISSPKGCSFPSTHSAEAFAVATILLTSFKKYGLIFVVFAALIAFSRLYLFVHYPFDVASGIILGVICSIAILYFIKPVVNKTSING